MTFVATTSPRFRHRDGPGEPLTLGETAAAASARGTTRDDPVCVAVLPSGPTYTLEVTAAGVRVMRQPHAKTADTDRPMTPADLQRINREYWTKQVASKLK